MPLKSQVIFALRVPLPHSGAKYGPHISLLPFCRGYLHDGDSCEGAQRLYRIVTASALRICSRSEGDARTRPPNPKHKGNTNVTPIFYGRSWTPTLEIRNQREKVGQVLQKYM